MARAANTYRGARRNFAMRKTKKKKNKAGNPMPKWNKVYYLGTHDSRAAFKKRQAELMNKRQAAEAAGKAPASIPVGPYQG